MHKKDLGTFGEMLVTALLIENGYNVYQSVGDNTRVDLIAETIGGKLIKIQVKTNQREKASPNTTILYLTKAGPNNYKFRYTKEQIDYFALVDFQTKKVAWVSSEILDQNKYQFKLSHSAQVAKHLNYFDLHTKIPF